MEILFIIGNGFDINIGMATRYSDFYKYYKNLDSPHSLVKDLKAAISNDINSWADLELAFGKFTKKINTPLEFDEVFEDIGSRLAEYLEYQESLFDIGKINKDDFFKYLCFPERSLLQADIDQLQAFKNTWKSHQWNVNIVTLNYTLSIERIFKGIINSTEIGTHNKLPITVNSIHHIHGFTNNRMIMGVNDTSQISNESFHDDTDVLEAIIKTSCNKAQKHNVDNVCTNLIAKSNLICIFGSSLGDTDNHWWELIGEQLKRGLRIIIFTKGEEVNPRIAYKSGRFERATKDRFLSKTKLNDNDKQKFASNIYVGVNTNMFSLV